MRLISQNRAVSFNYSVEDVYQAGIVLTGTEVKSLRASHCNIKSSFVKIIANEIFVINMRISVYNQANTFSILDDDPLRTRKLLLHKFEINKLQKAVQFKGYSIVPIKIYFKNDLVKLDIGLAKGKKIFDKRNEIAKKDMLREMQREFKSKNLNIK